MYYYIIIIFYKRSIKYLKVVSYEKINSCMLLYCGYNYYFYFKVFYYLI